MVDTSMGEGNAMNDVSNARLLADVRTIGDLRRSMTMDVSALTRAQGVLGEVDGAAVLASFADDSAMLGSLNNAANRTPFLFGRLQSVERVAPDAGQHWNAAISSLTSLSEVLQNRRGTVLEAAGLIDGALSSLGSADAAFGARLQAIAALVR